MLERVTSRTSKLVDSDVRRGAHLRALESYLYQLQKIAFAIGADVEPERGRHFFLAWSPHDGGDAWCHQAAINTSRPRSASISFICVHFVCPPSPLEWVLHSDFSTTLQKKMLLDYWKTLKLSFGLNVSANGLAATSEKEMSLFSVTVCAKRRPPCISESTTWPWNCSDLPAPRWIKALSPTYVHILCGYSVQSMMLFRRQSNYKGLRLPPVLAPFPVEPTPDGFIGKRRGQTNDFHPFRYFSS